jgi:endonuclease/exonuclease/phosphatase family metal-dependent hydrolase
VTRLRIATLNTWKGDGDYPRRLELMRAGLAALNLDIICLQECFAAPDAGAHTARELAHALNCAWAFLPGRRKMRAFEGRDMDSVSGLAVLTRHPILAADAIALPVHPLDPDRSAQIIDILLANGVVRVVNLHLTHVRDAAADEIRRAQIAAALDAACTPGGPPVVVAGDFNMPPNTQAFREMLHRPGADAGPLPPEAWARTISVGAHGAAIDHVVLIDPAGTWRMTNRETALTDSDPESGAAPSDHAAVVVELFRREATPSLTGG